jgi:hypothetical protein
MFDYEDADLEDMDELIEDQRLVLDGTVNLDYAEDEQIPRIKGLLELLSEYTST